MNAYLEWICRFHILLFSSIILILLTCYYIYIAEQIFSVILLCLKYSWPAPIELAAYFKKIYKLAAYILHLCIRPFQLPFPSLTSS